MFPSKVTFGTKPTNFNLSELGNLLDGYLDAMRRNGQIAGDGVRAPSATETVAFANLVRPDSWERKFHSEYSLKELDTLIQLFGQQPIWESLSKDNTLMFSDWNAAAEFYLESTMPDGLSPLWLFDSDESVPLYEIPLEFDNRERLYFWSREYNRMYGIWFSSGDLEAHAYEQMASPNSRLSRDGRKLASEIETAIGKPVFYFLIRYYGRGEEECNRVCPGCGNEWLLSSISDNSPELKFPLKCHKCRLVSQYADAEYADAEYDSSLAHIAEYIEKPEDFAT